jgi:ADP-heptose:LPS heptosyltransferase
MGDTAQMTSILQGLLADGWDITVLGKTQGRRLIEDNYPTVRWIEFDAPWTAFHGKYRLWRWPWKDILRVLREIRCERFAAAISTRRDPRDHVIFWLAGVPRRIGFRAPYGGLFLNEPVAVLSATEHRVEDWWSMQQRLSPTATKRFPPHLAPAPQEQEPCTVGRATSYAAGQSRISASFSGSCAGNSISSSHFSPTATATATACANSPNIHSPA